MKKLLSFILLLIFVIPFVLLGGCEKASVETREFSLFMSHFNEISTKIDGLGATDIAAEVGSDGPVNKLSFEYGTYLSSIVNTNDKYKFLNVLYGKMLDNALEFLYYYGYVCVSTSNEIDANKNSALYSAFDKLVISLTDVSNTMIQLERSIVMSKQGEIVNSNASICLEKLKNVYVAYEQAVNDACNLSYLMSDIYFENILQNQELTFVGREFVGESTIASTNRIMGANFIRARAIFYKLYYTDIFFVTNVANSDVPTKIISGGFIDSSSLNSLSAYIPWSNLTNYDLSANISFDTDISVDVNATNLKKGILNFLLNEATFKEQFVSFKSNIDKVDYYKVKYNSSYEPTATEISYKNLIDIFLSQYYQNNYYLLNYLLNIIY